MKKNFMTLIAIVSFSTIAYSQVGIHTETPKATLDVVASPDDTTKADGIIAPRLTGPQLQSKSENNLYGADQIGTIIYATSESPKAGDPNDITKNVDGKGYYYFDGDFWVKMKSDEGLKILLRQNTDTFNFLDHKEIDIFSFKYGQPTITMPPASEFKGRIIYIYNHQGFDIQVQFDPNETYQARQIINKIQPLRPVTYASDGNRWYSITGFVAF